MKDVASDYIQTVLTLMGVPKVYFDFADPMAVLLVFIFSTELFTFALAVVLWGLIAIFKTNDKWGIKEQKNNFGKKHKTHRYNAKDMRNMSKMGSINQMGNMKSDPSFLSVFITKFMVPVFVIFIALYVAIKMSGMG